MSSKILLLITLLAFSVIASQTFMYILSLKDVQLTLGANSYTELRKLIDAAMRSNFKYVIYIALLVNVLLVLSTMRQPTSMLFITSAIALSCLVLDIALTLKGSLPINDIINTWSFDQYPSNWQEYRTKWFAVFQYRQYANIIGLLSLLIGAVFGSK